MSIQNTDQQKCSSHNIQKDILQGQERDEEDPKEKVALSSANFLLYTERDAHGMG